MSFVFSGPNWPESCEGMPWATGPSSLETPGDSDCQQQRNQANKISTNLVGG